MNTMGGHCFRIPRNWMLAGTDASLCILNLWYWEAPEYGGRLAPDFPSSKAVGPVLLGGAVDGILGLQEEEGGGTEEVFFPLRSTPRLGQWKGWIEAGVSWYWWHGSSITIMPSPFLTSMLSPFLTSICLPQIHMDFHQKIHWVDSIGHWELTGGQQCVLLVFVCYNTTCHV